MGFVLKARSQRTSAFGLVCASVPDIRKDIHTALSRAVAETRLLAMPTNKRFPLQRLRRIIAHSMRLDVLFSRRVEKLHINTKPGTSFFPVKEVWGITPLWKVANKVHYYKADRICSMLHKLATLRRLPNGIVHDLVRLSIHIWTMTLSHFDGLCRRILSKIGKSLIGIGSSPDPVERMGTLSTNPVLTDRVNRNPPVIRRFKISRYRPSSLVCLVSILNERQKRLDTKRIKCLRTRTKVQ
jgi:hypothetical protein